MSNRDRDGQRLARQAQEPAWTDWSTDQDEQVGSSDRTGDDSSRDLPAWTEDAPPAGRRGMRSPEPAARTGSGATRGADKSRATEGRGRLPELSRSLSGSRVRRPKESGTPDPVFEEPDPAADWWQESEDWQSDAVPDVAAGSHRPARARAAHRVPVDRRPRGDVRSRQRQPRSAPSITVPPALAQATIFQDRLLLGIVGATAASLALMAAIVGNRIGQLPSAVALHLNAAGVPDLWGTRETLWRLPLAVAMLSVMNVVAAAFLLDRNQFVARFLVASSLLVNVLAWIAVLLIFW